MLAAKNLSKKYATVTVVNDVSLQVVKGEIVSVTGPSGAGKSTLLHLLGGLDKPDMGSVLINGTDMLQLPSRKQAKFRNEHIGFVFQFHHLMPEFSAVENVSMPLWIGGVGKKEAAAKAEEMLGIVGLSHRLNNKPSELSGGEQQRVAIARALVTRPSVIMADEPTGNLDKKNSELVFDIFRELAETYRQTLLIVTHDPSFAERTHRIIRMEDGRIIP